ncbi:TolC family protein [Flavobacterium piscisymbiosum]|uniref:TolC family protein n=1 Tax=Flavobacterium piscisymbiosum TaxID=2893753 RepID=A0ABS8MHK9_9FLAO|nr:TolC family protein [Flavobacterium sp. F-30]MCC9064974.1 TolC family protein [Flavobacterium sp. F-30]
MFIDKSKKLIYLLLTLQTSFLFAQNKLIPNAESKPLSIDQMWANVIDNSRKIHLNTLESTIAEEEISEIKIERLPEITLKGNYEYATNIPVYENGLFSKPTQHEVIHWLYKVSTDMYLNIYNGNKLNLKIDKKKTLSDIAKVQKDMTVSEIKLQGAIYYLSLQRCHIFKELMIKDIANQEKQLLEIKALYKNGVILKSDVLRVELKLSNQKMMLVKIENDIAIANQKLNILIGLPDLELVNPYQELDPALFELQSYESYLEVAQKKSYDYHISEKTVDLRKIELKSTKANVKPKIGMYGEFYLANPQIFLYPYSPSNYTLGIFGVRASIPISELYINRPKVKVAQLNLEKEEVEHHHIDDKIRQQVYENYLRFKESLIKIDVARNDVAQSTENARIVKQNYFNQAALITDLLDADIQLLQSRFDFASTKIAAQIQYYQLQNVLGTL